MKIQAGLCLVCLFTILTACNKEESIVDPRPVVLTEKQQILVEAGNGFGFEVLSNVEGLSPDSNYCISPLSISAALGMTLNGAQGSTAMAMQNTLGFGGMSQQEINDAYKKLLNYLLSTDPKITLEIANSIWHRDDFSVLPQFLQVNQDYFGASVHPVDFSDPATIGLINDWVSNNTHGHIPTIINFIPPSMVMYLINAVYYKADWTYAFNASHTQAASFEAPGGSVIVDMMKQRMTTDVLQNEFAHAVRLPYGMGRYAFIAMLPQEGRTMQQLINELTEENWKMWMNQFEPVDDFHLYMPKFKFSWERKLNEILAGMGMGVAFDPGMADFGGINPNYPLYISEVKHKTYIDVNEEGTEAAAVTSVGIGYTSINMLALDRPFLFFIVEKYTGAVIFAGKVANPTY